MVFGKAQSKMHSFCNMVDVLQIARVSKVFLVAERGHIARYFGKGLNDINIDDNEEVELEDDDGIVDLEDDVEDYSNHSDSASAIRRESRVGTLPEKSCNQSNEIRSKHEKKKHKKVRPKSWKTHEKEAVSLHFASAIMLK